MQYYIEKVGDKHGINLMKAWLWLNFSSNLFDKVSKAMLAHFVRVCLGEIREERERDSRLLKERKREKEEEKKKD